MTGEDKTLLEDLQSRTEYDLTLTNDGDSSDARVNPSSIDFVAGPQSLTISTGDDNELVTFTPVDPSTGDFAEETRTFSGLPDTGTADATLAGFSGGVDNASIVQKNGVTIQI